MFGSVKWMNIWQKILFGIVWTENSLYESSSSTKMEIVDDDFANISTIKRLTSEAYQIQIWAKQKDKTQKIFSVYRHVRQPGFRGQKHEKCAVLWTVRFNEIISTWNNCSMKQI